MISNEQEKRFFEKVEKTESCWLWIGAGRRNGYGHFWIGPRKTRKCISAHRVSYIISFGEIPAGMYVCHRCDNRRCVNPSHLWIGTCSDNLQDMHNKGRFPRTNQARGERIKASRLTAADVIEIRRKFETCSNKSEIARQFGVTQRSIHLVLTKETWSHI